jgi:hypothetical protein
LITKLFCERGQERVNDSISEHKSHNLKDFLGRIGVGFEVGLEVG